MQTNLKSTGGYRIASNTHPGMQSVCLNVSQRFHMQ